MAEQRDVHDPRLILRLAKLCGSRLYLRMLYLITVADIRSVSPVAWTSWKAGLLEQLYRNTAEWLEAGEEAEEAAAQFLLERAMNQAAATAAPRGRDPGAGRRREERGRGAARPDAAPLPARERARRGRRARARGARVPRRATSSRGSSRSATPRPSARSWGLVAVARDRPGLFATLAGVLSGCGHNILGGVGVHHARRAGARPLPRRPDRRRTRGAGARARADREAARGGARGRGRRCPRRRASASCRACCARSRPPRASTTRTRTSTRSSTSRRWTGRACCTTSRARCPRRSSRSSRCAPRRARAARRDAFCVTTLDGHKLVDPELQRRVEAAILRRDRAGRRVNLGVAIDAFLTHLAVERGLSAATRRGVRPRPGGARRAGRRRRGRGARHGGAARARGRARAARPGAPRPARARSRRSRGCSPGCAPRASSRADPLADLARPKRGRKVPKVLSAAGGARRSSTRPDETRPRHSRPRAARGDVRRGPARLGAHLAAARRSAARLAQLHRAGQGPARAAGAAGRAGRARDRALPGRGAPALGAPRRRARAVRQRARRAAHAPGRLVPDPRATAGRWASRTS